MGYQFCEWGKGEDYKKAFTDVCKHVERVLEAKHTIASCELIEYPIAMGKEWNEREVGNEVIAYIARDSYGELGRVQPLDCGAIDGTDVHVWAFYGIAK